MNDPNGWPDASKPGVPLYPERDGWHWVWGPKGIVGPLHWYSGDDGAYGDLAGSELIPGQAAREGYHYLGPCLTPAEVAAREAAAAEAMRERCRGVALLTSFAAADAIAALPPPAPDALDRVRAEAMREGMEEAAKWHDKQAVFYDGKEKELQDEKRFMTAHRAHDAAKAHRSYAAALRAMAEGARDE